ncbi:hypothetical protein X975_21698, partial [Stegodyphus mimosarum]
MGQFSGFTQWPSLVFKYPVLQKHPETHSSGHSFPGSRYFLQLETQGELHTSKCCFFGHFGIRSGQFSGFTQRPSSVFKYPLSQKHPGTHSSRHSLLGS